MEIKESIRNFVINDDLGNALEFLNKLRIESFDNEIIHHFASYNEIKSAERKGLITHEEISRRKAVLRNGILDLATEVEKHRKENLNQADKSYEVLKGYEINSETLFGTKSNRQLGFNDTFYLQRGYLDKELRTSILFHQNIILKGQAGSGKSRALLELIKKYLTKYSIVLPKIDSTKVNKLENKEKTVLLYDDLNLFFNQNFEAHFQTIKNLVKSDNLSIIATCRNSEFKLIMEQLGELSRFFKIVEIKPLSKQDKIEISDRVNVDLEDNSVDDDIGSFFEK